MFAMIDNETGRITNIDITPVSLELLPQVEPEGCCIGVDLAVGDDMTAEFTCHVNRLTLLSLITGKRITNNYLKYHGGVMVRKAHIRRCK